MGRLEQKSVLIIDLVKKEKFLPSQPEARDNYTTRFRQLIYYISNADNVSRYRCIMRIFFEHYEKLKYWLYQEEVYEEMIQDPLFADYRPEQCQQDLTMLTGNPHAFDNGTAAGNFLYQMIQMDLFAKSGIRVYYAGDLDPEGILIAQKLSQYYKGEFHYWHMETADYEKCRSEEVISPKRMKILERITDERLKPVVDRIEEYGTAGYQEMLVEEM